MGSFGDYLLDVLGAFGGGRGDPSHGLTRYGLGAIFWAFLLANARRYVQRSPGRERFLIFGFAAGLAAEVLAFVITSLDLYGVVASSTLESFCMPLEHTIKIVSHGVIAAAFICYFRDSMRTSGRYLGTVLAASLLFYVIVAPVWATRMADDPTLEFSRSGLDSVFHVIGLAVACTAIGLLWSNRSPTRGAILTAFAMFALDDALMLVGSATGGDHTTVITPIRHNLSLWAIPILGAVYLRESRTRREGLEARLRQSERLESLGQLAAGIAHDFNNDLQIIIGYAELVREEVGHDAPCIDHVSNVIYAGHRASGTVRQLMSFSVDQAYEPSAVDLVDVVAHLTPTLDRLLGENISIVNELADDVAPAFVDERMIQQVIVNLAVNSRDAMPDGGLVTVSVTTHQPAVDPDDSVPASAPQAAITVSDTGIGMDAATRRKAFDPFFTTKPVTQGTGLGLATVYGIVKQHGGTVSITSSPNRGTTVEVLLPLAAERVSENERSAVAHDAPPPGTTVLVAQDEYVVRDLIAGFLLHAGYEVIEAVDGQDAVDIALARHDEIDLFVFDVAMPKLNGLRAYDTIVEHGVDKPVLLITEATAPSPVRGIPLVHRPFTRAELLAAVRTRVLT